MHVLVENTSVVHIQRTVLYIGRIFGLFIDELPLTLRSIVIKIDNSILKKVKTSVKINRIKKSIKMYWFKSKKKRRRRLFQKNSDRIKHFLGS